MPIVGVVKRKVFETDSNGNIVYRESIDKKGNKKCIQFKKGYKWKKCLTSVVKFVEL